LGSHGNTLLENQCKVSNVKLALAKNLNEFEMLIVNFSICIVVYGTLSKTPAAPIPPPMHMVTRP
jgi:hypothetical protein